VTDAGAKGTIALDLIEDMMHMSRVSGMPEEVWRSEVASWWRPVAADVTEDLIRVPLEQLLARKRWFVSTWGSSGGDITATEEAITVLQRAERQFQEFQAALEAPISPSASNEAALKDADYLRPLTDFQRSSVLRLMGLSAGANFSVPGAGKTSTTLALWDQLKKRGEVTHLLVICPRSAFEAWQEEPLEIFSAPPEVFVYDGGPISTSAEVLLINYEKLESKERLEHVSQWVRSRDIHLVLDEAHRIKGGANSVRWQRCKALAGLVSRVDLLTGTPMPQGYDDLRNLMAISWPGVPRSFLTDSRLARLGQGGLFVRTTKDQLNLPEVKITLHSIEMGPYQAEIYKALRRNYSGIFRMTDKDESYFGAKGRAVMTLLAAASNPGLLMGIHARDAYLGLEWPSRDIPMDATLMDIVAQYVKHEVPAKYLWIAEYMKDAVARGQKVLIWSNFIGNIEALRRTLEPFNPAVIYGALDQEDRKLQLKKFREQSSCYALITNPQTLGEGVSLHHDCHEAIYLDRSYNAGHYLQSLDRIHRLGLEASQITHVHLLQATETIDVPVGIRLEQKIDRLAEALDDERLVELSLPDDFDTNANPTELFGLERVDLDNLLQHLGD